MNYLYLFSAAGGVAVANSWFVGFFIWNYDRKNTANKILCLLFLLLSFRIAECLIATFFLQHYLPLLLVGTLSLSLLGPVGWWYLTTLSGIYKPLNKIHFLVPVVSVLILLFFPGHLALEWIHIGLMINLAAYLIAGMRKLRHLPDAPKDKERWLRIFVYCGMAIWIIFSAELIFESLISYAFWTMVVAMILYYMTFEAARCHKVFKHIQPAKIPDNPIDISPIIALLEEEKLYLNSKLTKTLLAQRLGIKAYAVGKAINQIYGVSFTELLTGFRIEYAKGLLRDSDQDQYTIEHIAQSSGFSSLSNFYKVFKDKTGTTPAEYKKGR